MRIALAGNPNCGKTTLFNRLTGSHQSVGNWPGVTVEKKEGPLLTDSDVTVTDLPGIYSLQPDSPEEIVCLRFLNEERPDVIVNIVDGTNLERHLFLTTQLLELCIPMVVAINMTDLTRKRGLIIDKEILGELLGCPVIEITASEGAGVAELMRQSMLTLMNPKTFSRLKKVAFSSDKTENHEELVAQTSPSQSMDCHRDFTIAKRYQFIDHILNHCIQISKPKISISEKIDSIFLNRWLAIPCFIFIMGIIYYISVSSLGDFLNTWTAETLFGTWIFPFIRNILLHLSVTEWLDRLIVDGILGGVGAVLSFVPQMAILFFFLSFLEDCGYMARIAFMMDRIFSAFRLSGKSVIPMLISTGCGVPAIMATRTIENESQRRLTIITTTMIPCGAKLPMIALIAGSLSGNTWWIAPLTFFGGILAVALSCMLLGNFRAFRDDTTPFIMELPAYHLPRWRNLAIHVWMRCRAFIVKAGIIIFIACGIIWFLSNFGWDQSGNFGLITEERSILAQLGNSVAWFFSPLGFGHWKAAAATISGLLAKENIVGSLGIFSGMASVIEGVPTRWLSVRQLFPNTAAILAFLTFNLFCAPCVAAIGAIRHEMRSAKWTFFAIIYQTFFAYIIAFLVYQYGSMMSGDSYRVESFVAVGISIVFFALIWRSKHMQRTLKPKISAPPNSVIEPKKQVVCICKKCDHCPYRSCHNDQKANEKEIGDHGIGTE